MFQRTLRLHHGIAAAYLYPGTALWTASTLSSFSLPSTSTVQTTSQTRSRFGTKITLRSACLTCSPAAEWSLAYRLFARQESSPATARWSWMTETLVCDAQTYCLDLNLFSSLTEFTCFNLWTTHMFDHTGTHLSPYRIAFLNLKLHAEKLLVILQWKPLCFSLSPFQHWGLASDIVWPHQLHPELGGEEHLFHLHVQSVSWRCPAGYYSHEQLHCEGAAAMPTVPAQGGGTLWRWCAHECQDGHSTNR